jgi:ferredoxin-type protein NapH
MISASSNSTTVSTKNEGKLGPNGKPVRAFVLPTSMWGKLKVWRFIIYRRIVQIGTLLLFFGSAHWGWKLFDAPILRGNLSSSELLGFIPLADPFASLQIFISGHTLYKEALIGAAIVTIIYLLLGARVWSSWGCPINMVTDLAGGIRKKLQIKDTFKLRRTLRYAILAMSLVITLLMGVAAFEWISPISIFHRELIFGIGTGWVVIIAIFLFDLFVLKHGWCGHLCPLGAFYSVLGKITTPLRISFDMPSCTHCVECVHVCPEPQVLNFKLAGESGLINSSECTNCGRCINVCPEDSLKFQLRHSINKNLQQSDINKIPIYPINQHN